MTSSRLRSFALGAPQLQPLLAATGYRYPRARIIAAIFETAQALNNDGNDTLLTDVADNTGHMGKTSKRFPGRSATRPARNGILQ